MYVSKLVENSETSVFSREIIFCEKQYTKNLSYMCSVLFVTVIVIIRGKCAMSTLGAEWKSTS